MELLVESTFCLEEIECAMFFEHKFALNLKQLQVEKILKEAAEASRSESFCEAGPQSVTQVCLII